MDWLPNIFEGLPPMTKVTAQKGRNRLTINILQLLCGEAEGPFAIVVFLIVVLAVLVVFTNLHSHP